MVCGGAGVLFGINFWIGEYSADIRHNSTRIEKNTNAIEQINDRMNPLIQELQKQKIHFEYLKQSMGRMENDLDYLVKQQQDKAGDSK